MTQRACACPARRPAGGRTLARAPVAPRRAKRTTGAAHLRPRGHKPGVPMIAIVERLDRHRAAPWDDRFEGDGSLTDDEERVGRVALPHDLLARAEDRVARAAGDRRAVPG